MVKLCNIFLLKNDLSENFGLEMRILSKFLYFCESIAQIKDQNAFLMGFVELIRFKQWSQRSTDTVPFIKLNIICVWIRQKKLSFLGKVKWQNYSTSGTRWELISKYFNVISDDIGCGSIIRYNTICKNLIRFFLSFFYYETNRNYIRMPDLLDHLV